MLKMVSELTGVIRGYYGKWQRPLRELREELQDAHKLGNRIVRVTAERPWRQAALKDILRSLRIQDGQMHDLVRHILIDATVSYQIAQHKDVHEQLHAAFQEEDAREILDVSRQLYRLSHQTLDFLDSDPSHTTAFNSKLARLKREDPLTYRRIAFTLNEVARLQSEDRKGEIPKPRSSRGAVGIYKTG